MLATFSQVMTWSRRYIFPHYRRYSTRFHRISVDCFHKGTVLWFFLLTWINCWTNSRASKEFSKGSYTWYLICVPDFRHFHQHNMETFSAFMAPFEGDPLMTGVPPPPSSQWVNNAEFWPIIRNCLCSETPWCSYGVTVIETFIHSQYNPGCTINKAKQNKKCKQKNNSFDFTIKC